MQTGVALLLGGLLVAAGLPKAAAPRYVAGALRRVVRRGSDRGLRLAGRLLGAWELALGAALVLAGGRAGVVVAALAALTFAGFVGFVGLAIRRGAACGCWASLSEGPAGGAELGRAVFLAAVAADLLVARVAGAGAAAAPLRSAGWPALAWAAGLLTGAWLAALLGAALLPVPTQKLRQRIGMQSAPGVLGRLAAHAALLAGFVHAGTRSGRRRYLARVGAARLAAPPAAPVRQARTALPARPPAGAAALATTEGSTR